MVDEATKESVEVLGGRAEAILSSSYDADSGIEELVNTYKSGQWDDPKKAIDIVSDYSNQMRAKKPGEENLLTSQETFDIAPVKIEDVGYDVKKWEQDNIAIAKQRSDPYLAAYDDSIQGAITDAATGLIQRARTEIAKDDPEYDSYSAWQDKEARVAASTFPGLIKAFGVESYFERQMRSDSNDTLASALASVGGNILSLPATPVNLVTNPLAFGYEEYKQSKAAGAPTSNAVTAGGIEAANQVVDVVLDKMLLGVGKAKVLRKLPGVGKLLGSGVEAIEKLSAPARIGARGLGEGLQEFAQNKISEMADLFGFTQDEKKAFINEQDLTAFAAGAIGGSAIGGLEQTGVFGSPNEPAIDTGAQIQNLEKEDLSAELGISFKETEPLPNIAIIGEPVNGGTNLTTVGEASTGVIGPVEGDNAITTDSNEAIVFNPDGTSSRVVNGVKKQAHQEAMIVSEETAKKIAALQDAPMTEEAGPITPMADDLGRLYIEHPNVAPDLTYTPNPITPSPVAIPPADTGHILQYSSGINELGSVEHRTAISKGKTTGGGSIGAGKLENVTTIEKYRDSPLINDRVKEILELDSESVSKLAYFEGGNDVTKRAVDSVMSQYENNYVPFISAMIDKRSNNEELTIDEANAAGYALEALSTRAKEFADTDPVLYEKYSNLAADAAILSAEVKTKYAQGLQSFSTLPITGNQIVGKIRSDTNELAKAKAAQDFGVSVKQVDNVVKEDAQLDKINQGINEREAVINEQEVKAEEAHNAPEQKITDIEKEIIDVDNAVSPEIAQAEKKFDEVHTKSTEVEKRAGELDVEAAEVGIPKQQAISKRQQAAKLRATQKLEETKAKEALREANKQKQQENKDRRSALKEQLRLAKELRDQTKEQRKELLKQQKAEAKAQKEALNKDREKIQARKDRNKQLKDAVESYKKSFASRFTPAKTEKINRLVDIIKTSTGSARKLALDDLGKTLAEIKGVKILAGGNPFHIYWQANVLSSLGTQFTNIRGNVFGAINKTLKDIGRGDFSKASRFVRAWTSALLSKRSIETTKAGLRGDISPKNLDLKLESETELKDIASGTKLTKETDAIRSIQLSWGTGKLGKLLSAPGIVLRAVGAMDAVFSRAATQGELARREPTYNDYLKAKADNYGTYVTQAKNEASEFKQLGIRVPDNFVNDRADELHLESKPQDTQDSIIRSAKKQLFQNKPTGALAKASSAILRFIAKTPVGRKTNTYLNAKDLTVAERVAAAVGYSNRVAREDVSVDEIYPLVVKGLAEGQTLVINGKDVTGTSTRVILGEVVNAVNNKQLINLRGESARPLKYFTGMFVNTAASIMDAGMEGIPVIGYLDKALGGAYSNPEFTVEDRQELLGNQIASAAITGALLAALVPGMSDEDHATFYVYGGLRDATLRKAYEVKGIKPFTIRIGDRTFSYKDVPGLNLLLGGIGELSDAHMVAKRTPDNPLTTKNWAESMGVGVLYAASQLTLLKNLSIVTDLAALKDADKSAINTAGDVVSNITQGFVPFSGATREMERFVYGDLSRPKEVQNRMIQNIPFTKFFSDNKPALNIFGKPIRTSVTPGIGNFIGEADHSVGIDWLTSNGYTVQLPRVTGKLSKKDQETYKEMLDSKDPENFEPYLTSEDQYKYQELVGPGLEELLTDFSNRYPKGFDDQVQKDLNKEFNQIKNDAKDRILNKY